MEKLQTIPELLMLLSEEPRYQKETLEEWALKLIKECAEKCIPDGNPVVAKIKIQDIFTKSVQE